VFVDARSDGAGEPVVDVRALGQLFDGFYSFLAEVNLRVRTRRIVMKQSVKTEPRLYTFAIFIRNDHALEVEIFHQERTVAFGSLFGYQQGFF